MVADLSLFAFILIRLQSNTEGSMMSPFFKVNTTSRVLLKVRLALFCDWSCISNFGKFTGFYSEMPESEGVKLELPEATPFMVLLSSSIFISSSILVEKACCFDEFCEFIWVILSSLLSTLYVEWYFNDGYSDFTLFIVCFVAVGSNTICRTPCRTKIKSRLKIGSATSNRYPLLSFSTRVPGCDRMYSLTCLETVFNCSISLI